MQCNSNNFNAPQFQGQTIQQNASVCSLAPPRQYMAACNPSPLHRASCQSSPYFNLNVSYGRY